MEHLHNSEAERCSTWNSAPEQSVKVKNAGAGAGPTVFGIILVALFDLSNIVYVLI